MIYHIYCDESRQTKHRYMLIGGLIIQRSDIPGLDATIKKFRKDEGLSAELKWTKVSNYKLAQYKRFVDYFFALSNTDTLHFHSIVIDNHMVDHKKYSGGNKEKSFYKFYYQLFVNCFAKFYCEKNSEAKFLVYPDRRKTSYSLSDLKSIVNNGVWKQFKNPTDPFRAIEPRKSKDEDLLQMTDVILGAIGYHKNGYHLLAGSSHAKSELAEYIAKHVGVKDLGKDTPYKQLRFKVWNIKLKK